MVSGMIRWLRTTAMIAVMALCAPPVRADVTDSASNGFTVKIAVDVAAPAAKAYGSIVDVASWWDPEHTYSGKASNLSIDATPGGCFCEKLPNGGVRHLTVVYADSGKVLRLSGGLGPMQDMAVSGSLNFALAESAGKTTIVLTYKVGGYLPGGVDAMAKPADAMLTGAMQRLKRFIDTGKP
jgi:hypothetical protein